jgi:hypothetical protein
MAFLAKPTDVVAAPPAGAVQCMRYVRRVRVNEPTIYDTRKRRQLAEIISATNEALRPIADSLDAFGRPAGLDQDHPHTDYCLADNGRRGTLASGLVARFPDLVRDGVPTFDGSFFARRRCD